MKSIMMREHERLRSISVLRAGSVTTILTVANIAVGFIFQALIASRLGLGPLADTFQLGWSVVTFGAVLFASMVPILLIPRMHNGSETIHIGDLPLIVALGALLTSIQACIALPQSGDLADLLLFSSPCHVLAASAAGPQAIAYLRRRFVAAGAVGLWNGVGLLGATVILQTNGLTAAELGAALTAGYVAQLLGILIPVMTDRKDFDSRVLIGAKAVLGVATFTMLTKFQPLLERMIAGTVDEGATASLGFGQKIAQGLLILAGFGLSLTAAGSLSRSVASGDRREAARILARTLTATVLCTSVVIAAYIPFNRTIVEFVFYRGEMSIGSVDLIQTVVVAQYLWVIANALAVGLTSYLYAEHAYVGVALASILGLIVTFISANVIAVNESHIAVPIASGLGATATLIFAFLLTTRYQVANLLRQELMRYRSLLLPSLAVLSVSLASYEIAETLVQNSIWSALLATLINASAILIIVANGSFRLQARGLFSGSV